MQCPRLKSLLRDWYQQVRNYTLSPLKMMELVMRHIKNCEVCQTDEDLPFELEQLREIIRVPYNEKFQKMQEESFGNQEEDLLFEEEEKILLKEEDF